LITSNKVKFVIVQKDEKNIEMNANRKLLVDSLISKGVSEEDIKECANRLKAKEEIGNLVDILQKNISKAEENEKSSKMFNIVVFDLDHIKKISKSNSQCRVLIVDDVRSTRKSIKDALIDDNFLSQNIVSCHKVKKAKDELRSSFKDRDLYFDLIIIDMYMNGKIDAGTKLCKFIEKEVKPKYEESKAQFISLMYAVYRDYVSKRGIGNWNKFQENMFLNQLKSYLSNGTLWADVYKNPFRQHQDLREILRLYLEHLRANA